MCDLMLALMILQLMIVGGKLSVGDPSKNILHAFALTCQLHLLTHKFSQKHRKADNNGEKLEVMNNI
ncbi:hypothetical protein VNO80_06088 [Phaseolus coccineus]|uniref:Secreted protein n=1 Tax=Phaseolus coccineus TaxID=3886 RepID=A0AAN9NHF9_PHACN